MSLAIACKGAEGIVLGTDSRVTLSMEQEFDGQTYLVPSAFDNATKLLRVVDQDFVGAVVYGLGAIGEEQPRTPRGLITKFEAQLAKERPGRLSVEAFARALGEFYMGEWEARVREARPTDSITFLVGGYDEDQVYGRLFEVVVPHRPIPVEHHANEGSFGIVWGGQLEIVDRLIRGLDGAAPGIVQEFLNLSDEQTDKLKRRLEAELDLSIPHFFLPLQDCVDLVVTLIRTTIAMHSFQVHMRGVGGAIRVATITRKEGFRYLQRKEIHSEEAHSFPNCRYSGRTGW